ncbi:MAG: LytTr DNA-binding domain protein [Lysobacteraceae bacterium]|nr:MAG: LytTr DNA-binding domain protein [Xanthomonadaceae bacterium]
MKRRTYLQAEMNEVPDNSHQQQGLVIRAARMAFGSLDSRPVATWFVVGLGTGLFLALVGALESYNYSFAFRIGFWLGLCLTGAAVAATIEFLLNKVQWSLQRSYTKWLAFILIFATLMTPIAFLANSTGGLKPWYDLLMYFQNSLVISGVFVGIRLLVRELYHYKALFNRGRAAKTQTMAFMQRLPVQLRRGNLRALCADGHYIRAWTDLGSDLVLFRLKDAIRELQGLEGMQVHRGWWVARAAIQGSRRENGRLFLLLEGDIEVPVSRSNVKALREAGWL